MNIESFREYCLSKNGVTEETPFGPDALVFKVAGKLFALCGVDVFSGITLKVDPENGVALRERYSSIIPAYHMNKKHWISVSMKDGLPDKFVKTLIDDSYNLVMSKLTRKLRLTLEPNPKKSRKK